MASTETFAQPRPPPLALRPSSASPRVVGGGNGGGGGGPRSPLGTSASGRRMSPALLSEVEAAWDELFGRRLLSEQRRYVG